MELTLISLISRATFTRGIVWFIIASKRGSPTYSESKEDLEELGIITFIDSRVKNGTVG
jgi:hypothetical protein